MSDRKEDRSPRCYSSRSACPLQKRHN